MPNKLEQPAGNASTDEWRAFATQVDPENADGIAEMGRDELRDKYADATPAEAPDPLQPQNAPGFVNVMPPVPTDVPDYEVFRVSISDQQWTLDAVEFPYATNDDPDARIRVDRAAPLLVSEDEADALIQAAGERGFALTKEKVA